MHSNTSQLEMSSPPPHATNFPYKKRKAPRDRGLSVSSRSNVNLPALCDFAGSGQRKTHRLVYFWITGIHWRHAGCGGWAAIRNHAGQTTWHSGAIEWSRPGRAELLGLVTLAANLATDEAAIVHTDLRSLIRTIDDLRSGRPPGLINRDLLSRLQPLAIGNRLTAHFAKGSKMLRATIAAEDAIRTMRKGAA